MHHQGDEPRTKTYLPETNSMINLFRFIKLNFGEVFHILSFEQHWKIKIHQRWYLFKDRVQGQNRVMCVLFKLNKFVFVYKLIIYRNTTCKYFQESNSLGVGSCGRKKKLRLNFAIDFWLISMNQFCSNIVRKFITNDDAIL